MKSEWERMVYHFESTARCVHKNKPRVFYEPGLTVVDTNGNCLCQSHDGDGLPLTQVLAEWIKSFGA